MFKRQDLIVDLLLSVAAVVSLLVPLCAGIVALARVRNDYFPRTVCILGRMFIATAIGMAVVGSIGALMRGEQPIWPYLVITGLPAVAVARIMQQLVPKDTPLY
jgi:hypothetical protein